MLRGTIGRRRAFRNEAVIAFVFADILLAFASRSPRAAQRVKFTHYFMYKRRRCDR